MSLDNSSVIEDVNTNGSESSVNDNGTSINKEDKAEKGILAELIKVRKEKSEYAKKLEDIAEAESLKKGEYEKIISEYKSKLTSLEAMIAEKDSIVEKWNSYESKQREQYKSILGDIPNMDNLSLEQLEYLSNKIKTKVPDISVESPKPKNPTEPS